MCGCRCGVWLIPCFPLLLYIYILFVCIVCFFIYISCVFWFGSGCVRCIILYGLCGVIVVRVCFLGVEHVGSVPVCPVVPASMWVWFTCCYCVDHV